MCLFDSETFIQKEKNESPNDRNDRGMLDILSFSLECGPKLHVKAIRTATKWYADHAPSSMSILLVTDDRDNRQKAQALGLNALSGIFIDSLVSLSLSHVYWENSSRLRRDVG